jgi:hypothetical protein
MQIVYHIGANCTDADRLLRALLRNAETLRSQGICVPGPGRYRKVLREATLGLVDAAHDAAVTPDTREALLDTIIDGQDARRLVMSNSTFLCTPQRVFDGGRFYGLAAAKARALGTLFPGDEIEIFLGLRNPATFIPAVWRQAEMDFAPFMAGLDPRTLRWSEVVAAIRAAMPSARLCVWCNEDTALIWGTLLRRLAGVAPDHPMAGDYELLSDIMAPDGMQRFLSYMETHPGQTELQVRRVIGAFLDKFAIPDAIEEEIDVPGWDARMVDEITRAYEADVARIMAMPGVEFVDP